MSPHTIDVRVDDRYRTRVEPGVLREAAERTLVQQRVADEYDMAIVIAGDQVLRELNRRYRGLDMSTDVLAFPGQTEGPFIAAPGSRRYLGDVIISFAQAEAQAARAENDLTAELQLLVVHGVLHLLGYDDQTESAGAQMWERQRAVLDELGVEVHITD